MVFTKAFSLGEKVAKISDFCRMWGKKACYARHFDLLRNSHSTVPPVRRRVRVACLDGSFDLCQSVKKEFFDRLNAPGDGSVLNQLENLGADTLLPAKALGPGSDREKYIFAALVVPKSWLEPEFCTELKASRNI